VRNGKWELGTGMEMEMDKRKHREPGLCRWENKISIQGGKK